jgi:protein-tyrosine-phosphatase
MAGSTADHDSSSWRARARRLAKVVIPKRVVQEILRYRNYKPLERPLYIKLRVLDGLGLRKERSRKIPTHARSFLFVCFGNIMRSPMCEALMKRALESVGVDMRVTSAGLNATPGRPAHPWSVLAARDFGIDLSQHRARLLSFDMLEQADAIFAMDYQNHVELLCRYPAVKEKVFMLSAYAGDDYASTEIRDPFYGNENETKSCYRILQNCVNNLIAVVTSNAKVNAVRSENSVSTATDSRGSG